MRLFRHFSGCRRGFYKRWMMKRISRKLDLQQDQREKLDDISRQLADSKGSFTATRAEARQQMLALLDDNTLDRDRATEIIRDHLAAVAVSTTRLVDGFAEFFDSLNPQQRQQLQVYVQGHACHRRGCCR